MIDDIEISDIPGAALVGSLLTAIGDIILFSGDIVIASIGALLGNVEIVGSMISAIGRAASESGFMSAGVADQLTVVGVLLLAGGLAWRALRVLSRDIQKRITS